MKAPENEWAREATEILNSFLSGSFLNRVETVEKLSQILGAAYHTGVEEEREACAKVAENFNKAGEPIATAIRLRLG